MLRISEESYERVDEIFEDIGYICDTDDDFEEWEDVARASFATVLDGLDTERFDMTCAAVKEKINERFEDGEENFARGIRAAFYGYLCERRDYLDFSEEFDRPELPEDADESDREQYDEAMEAFYEKKEYNDCVEKWIDDIRKLTLE